MRGFHRNRDCQMNLDPHSEPRGWSFAGHGHGRRGGPFGRGRGGGRGGGGPDGEGFMRRILGHGDLRYVILGLLEAKPCHGYELIKLLEEKSAGHYTPSPGVIYPTLTFLEEGGYATSTTDQNKKLFTITDEGRTLLNQNRALVDEIFERLTKVGEKMSKLREWFGAEEYASEDKDTRHYLRGIMHQLRGELFRRMPIGKATQKQIAEIIERALTEIRALK